MIFGLAAELRTYGANEDDLHRLFWEDACAAGSHNKQLGGGDSLGGWMLTSEEGAVKAQDVLHHHCQCPVSPLGCHDHCCISHDPRFSLLRQVFKWKNANEY